MAKKTIPDAPYPRLDLPVVPPYAPMEAKSVERIPSGEQWVYEPKWDGFRCLAYRDGDAVALQSKAGQPLGRYFPEIIQAVAALRPEKFVLDGEIVIIANGRLSFDDLLMRIHPAESRIRRLAAETPARLLVFDMLVDEKGRDITDRPLRERRETLEAFLAKHPHPSIERSPVSADRAKAERWMKEFGAIGCDGVVAKLAEERYHSGDREAMQKIKRLRTADCVVGGFRYASGAPGVIGSLLLGLYNEHGTLDHVGFAASFTASERAELKKVIEPLKGGRGFTGRAPGGPSRWSTERTGEWEPLEPALVAEVRYDHFSGGRFRHGTKFLRWRPEKKPKQCTFDQLA
ncbi:MAG: ATP-dependent DNA ligase [Vicinamibacterales bacterium]